MIARKLGQILATKTEMLPLPYTRSLSGLLDKLPAVSFAQVGKLLCLPVLREKFQAQLRLLRFQLCLF
jgi:predicted unusual protein kinase regulating ubiquinone biosynthesis (AarF/ABC1/UbiB family)